MPLVPSPLRDVARAQSVSGGKASRAYAVLQTMCGFTKLFAGDTARPDLDALVSSGIFEQCLGIVHAFERAGVERLGDASPAVLQMALCLIKLSICDHTETARSRFGASALDWRLQWNIPWT